MKKTYVLVLNNGTKMTCQMEIPSDCNEVTDILGYFTKTVNKNIKFFVNDGHQYEDTLKGYSMNIDKHNVQHTLVCQNGTYKLLEL